MDDNNKLAELANSVESLREDVKRADDTFQGVENRLRTLLMSDSADSHALDRVRSRVIDIDGKLDEHGERFDRIDETLRQILEKIG
jgi:predicted nuclease with TOPRIM domain